MVYLLVYDLPPDVEYRILFMHRNLDEVLASQRVMLDRLGKPSPIDDEKMATLFRNHLIKFAAWAKERPNIRVLDVNYNDMVADPAPIVADVNTLFGRRPRYCPDGRRRRSEPLSQPGDVSLSLHPSGTALSPPCEGGVRGGGPCVSKCYASGGRVRNTLLGHRSDSTRLARPKQNDQGERP